MTPVTVYNMGSMVRDLLTADRPDDPQRSIRAASLPENAFETPSLLSPLLMTESLNLRKVRVWTDVLCAGMTYSFEVLDANESVLFQADIHLNNLRDKSSFFNVRVTDPMNNVVLLCEKRFQTMSVAVPSINESHLIGSVVKHSFCLRPKISVLDHEGKPVFHMSGPFFKNPLFKEVAFPILSRDNVYRVGAINNLYDGCCFSQYWTKHSKFSLNFPRDLDVRMKAVLMCATLLIDVSFFE